VLPIRAAPGGRVVGGLRRPTTVAGGRSAVDGADMRAGLTIGAVAVALAIAPASLAAGPSPDPAPAPASGGTGPRPDAPPHTGQQPSTLPVAPSAPPAPVPAPSEAQARTVTPPAARSPSRGDRGRRAPRPASSPTRDESRRRTHRAAHRGALARSRAHAGPAARHARPSPVAALPPRFSIAGARLRGAPATTPDTALLAASLGLCALAFAGVGVVRRVARETGLV
jgi:type IV secretory pathway VirB10-like protein